MNLYWFLRTDERNAAIDRMHEKLRPAYVWLFLVFFGASFGFPLGMTFGAPEDKPLRLVRDFPDHVQLVVPGHTESLVLSPDEVTGMIYSLVSLDTLRGQRCMGAVLLIEDGDFACFDWRSVHD